MSRWICGGLLVLGSLMVGFWGWMAADASSTAAVAPATDHSVRVDAANYRQFWLWGAVKPQPVSVEVRRPDEQVARRFVWQPGADGLYQYQLQLAENAPTGRWQLLLDLGDGRQDLYEFLVEDFLPERLALELKGSEQPLDTSEDPSFSVNGRYLYGAPASGNRVSGQVYVRPLREAVKSLPGYQFGSVTEEELSQDFELDESVLDAKGQPLAMSVSIGGYVATPGEELDHVLQAGDEALYAAKGAGRNAYRAAG